MAFKQLDDGFSVSPQLDPGEVEQAARDGYRSIISNRPDGEEPGQPTAATMRAEAERHGLAFAHIPIVSGKATDADGDEMRRALDTMPGPILGSAAAARARPPCGHWPMPIAQTLQRSNGRLPAPVTYRHTRTGA